ncbi:MAG: WD40 repeat domain-containing protein [Bryobacterales bacterium]|nr:WD40 repeat domain-containing protein [Bryobacterales bacterium]
MAILDRVLQSDAAVLQVSFSADPSRVAGVCADNKVRFWDPVSGTLIRTVPWRERDRRSVTLKPGATRLAAAGDDRVIKIWDLGNGELLHRLSGHEQLTGASVFSTDGKLFASSSAKEQSVRIWNLSTSRQQAKLQDGFGGASVLAFSPDSKFLVCGNFDTNLRIWDVGSGRLVHTIEDLLVAVFQMSFSPDGKYLVAAGVDRNVYVWESATWKLARKLTGQPEMISALAFSGDGRRIVTGGFDARAMANPTTAIVWDLASGETIRKVQSPRAVSSAAFATDGNAFALAARANQLHIWRASA